MRSNWWEGGGRWGSGRRGAGAKHVKSNTQTILGNLQRAGDGGGSNEAEENDNNSNNSVKEKKMDTK